MLELLASDMVGMYSGILHDGVLENLLMGKSEEIVPDALQYSSADPSVSNNNLYSNYKYTLIVVNNSHQ